jgi:hypothetical protein
VGDLFSAGGPTPPAGAFLISQDWRIDLVSVLNRLEFWPDLISMRRLERLDSLMPPGTLPGYRPDPFRPPPVPSQPINKGDWNAVPGCWERDSLEGTDPRFEHTNRLPSGFEAIPPGANFGGSTYKYGLKKQPQRKSGVRRRVVGVGFVQRGAVLP